MSVHTGLTQAKLRHIHGCVCFTEGLVTSPPLDKNGGTDYDLLFSGSFTVVQAKYSSEDVSSGQRRAGPHALDQLRKRPTDQAPGTSNRHHCHPTDCTLDSCAQCVLSLLPSPRRTGQAFSKQEMHVSSCFQMPLS